MEKLCYGYKFFVELHSELADLLHMLHNITSTQNLYLTPSRKNGPAPVDLLRVPGKCRGCLKGVYTMLNWCLGVDIVSRR